MKWPFLLCALAVPAHAGCGDLATLIQTTRSQTPTHPILAQPDTCGLALTATGTTQYHCAWAYPLRAPQAQQIFAQLQSDLSACGYTATPQTAQVNHPDSFDQIEYANGQTQISLSLKDKGALGQTFLFLRVAQN